MSWQQALVQAVERGAEAHEYDVWYSAVLGNLSVMGFVVGVCATFVICYRIAYRRG